MKHLWWIVPAGAVVLAALLWLLCRQSKRMLMLCAGENDEIM